MTSHIYLDTRNAVGDNNYDTRWDIRNPRLNVLDSFKISVRSIEFPNTVYPTNEYNNVVEVTEDGVNAWTISLTENVYTGSTFATALASSLNDVDVSNPLTGTYTVTYDSTSKKFTITSTVAFTFVLVSNSAYDSMGLSTSDFSSYATTWTSSYPAILSGTQYVDVITNISNLSYNSKNSGHIICRVPVNVSFGNTVFYKNDFNDNLVTSTLHLDEVSLKLKDDNNNPFKLPDNAYLSLVLNIETDEGMEMDRNYS